MLQIWGEHVADCLEGTGMRKTHMGQEKWMSPYAYPPSIRNPPNHRSGERKLFRNGKVIMYVVHVCGGQRGWDYSRPRTFARKTKPNKTPRTSGLTTLWIQKFKVKRQLEAVEGQELPGSWRESWEAMASIFVSASYPGVTYGSDPRPLSDSWIPGMWGPQSILFTGVDLLTCGPGRCPRCLVLYRVMARALQN